MKPVVSARYCECERSVLPMFSQKTSYGLLLEHEQRAQFYQIFSKFARQASVMPPVEALRK